MAVKMIRKKLTVPAATAVGTRVRFTDKPLTTTDFTVYVSSANAGLNVYIGDSTVDNTWIPRLKGSTVGFVHGTGNMSGEDIVAEFNLADFYFYPEAVGDQIIIEYMSRTK